ncbi:MAG: hypothetical protein IT435_12195 [Phycisphaerales bacterium]|nr:hypothetical protein [Phycisphaerales bacterium]
MKTAFVFDPHFRDQTRVVIVIDVAFGTPEAARTETMRYMHPLGKLPTPLRKGIDNSLVVHMGGENTTAFSDHGLIIVYSDNATKRIGTHDLEETIFHESVHASWDGEHARSPEWAAARPRMVSSSPSTGNGSRRTRTWPNQPCSRTRSFTTPSASPPKRARGSGR